MFTHFLQRPSRIPILAIDARLCLFHPRADEARVPPEQQTGLSECRQSGGGPSITSSPKHPWLSTPPLADRCSRNVLALHLKRLFDNAGLPTTTPRDSALRAVTKEVVEIRVLLTRSPFVGGIPHRLLRRVSVATPTFVPSRFRVLRRTKPRFESRRHPWSCETHPGAR